MFSAFLLQNVYTQTEAHCFSDITEDKTKVSVIFDFMAIVVSLSY